MRIEEVNEPPMIRPSQLKFDSSATGGKTLFEQLKENQQELRQRRTASSTKTNNGNPGTTNIKDILKQTKLLEELRERETPYLAQSVSLCILLSVIFAVLQTAIFIQYQMPVELSATNPQLWTLAERTGAAFLSLQAPVYYSHRWRNRWWMQLLLVLAAVFVGAKNLLLILSIPGGINYDQFVHSAGMGTLWAYSLLQLKLPLAIFALLAVFGAQYLGQLQTLDLSQFAMDLKTLTL
jgi:hypothetical protein